MPRAETLRVASSNGDGVSVVVSDTGTGIAQEHIPAHLRSIFHHEIRAARGPGQRHGAGPVRDYGIIQEHAGKIRVESHPDEALPFIWISRRQGRLSMSELATIPRPNLGEGSESAGSVLIIDDEAAIRESWKLYWRWKATRLQSAATADEGLNRIGDRPYDWFCSTLRLPDRNGIDLLPNFTVTIPSWPSS